MSPQCSSSSSVVSSLSAIRKIPAERDIVVLAASTRLRYAFLAPVTALTWRFRAKFHPVLVLVGEPSAWTQGKLGVVKNVLNDLVKAAPDEMTVVELPCAAGDETFVAQMIRLYLGSFEFLAEDSWTIINDVDMWPLNPDMYRMGRNEGKVLSNNAACCGPFHRNGKSFQELPMGTIGMRVRDWRGVFRIAATNDTKCIVETIRQRATQMFGGTITDFRGAHWRDDQHMLSMYLLGNASIVGKMMFVGRTFDRLDRLEWPRAHCLPWVANEGNDAHVPIPGDEQWSTMIPLFRALVPQEYWALADDYVAKYKAAN